MAGKIKAASTPNRVIISSNSITVNALLHLFRDIELMTLWVWKCAYWREQREREFLPTHTVDFFSGSQISGFGGLATEVRRAVAWRLFWVRGH